MIQALIFDIDGVLVRSGNFGAQIAQELQLQRASLDAFWHGPFARCSLGASDLKHELAPYLKEWGYPGSVEDCLRAWFEADATLNTELLEHVDRLRARGIPCHVASTQERHRAAYLEGPLGLARRFDRLFFSCHLGFRKPDPEFYRRVTAELGLAPAAILFLDDQQANVDAARAAGWHAELYAIGDAVLPLLERHGVAAR